ncbi:MAG: hypothetical protein KKF74_00880, partial [Nanoarchaeota archaeon]|nr:hypothetical protein [Nanoarchaeota archaeon]
MENSFLGKEGKLTLSFIVILSIFLLVLISLSLEVPAALDEGEGDTTNSHKECVDEKCIYVPGSGRNTCTEHIQCASHKECVDGKCKEVAGSGRNTCKYDSQCSHKECVNGECKSVIGQRSDMCHYQSDCKDEEKCSCMACVGGCDPGCKMQTFYGDDCPCSDDCSECGGEGPEEESEEEEQIPVSEPTGCPSKYQYECYSPYFCPQGHQCISGGKTYCDIKCKKICSMEYADEEIKNKYKIIWCRKDTTCPCQEKVGGDFGCFSSGESCYGAIKGCIPSEPTPPELEPPEPELCVKEGKKGSVFNADPNDDVCCAGLEKVQDSYPIEEGVYYPMKDLYTIKKSLYYPTKECLVYKNNFVCTKCGDSKCGLGENYCNCPKDCKEWTICTDSDGGKDYYVKGEITGELMSGEGSPSVDMCIDWGNDGNDNIVRELFCNDQGKGEPTLYECPY